MKNLLLIISVIFLINIVSCQQLKPVSKNNLELYEIAKSKIKSSIIYSNFLKERNISCGELNVGNFLMNPCYFHYLISENLQKEIYNFDCPQEIEVLGAEYKNLDKLSDAKPSCLKLFFSEIVQDKYIIAEIQENNQSQFYYTLTLILEIKNNSEIEIIEHVELINE